MNKTDEIIKNINKHSNAFANAGPTAQQASKALLKLGKCGIDLGLNESETVTIRGSINNDGEYKIGNISEGIVVHDESYKVLNNIDLFEVQLKKYPLDPHCWIGGIKAFKAHHKRLADLSRKISRKNGWMR